MKINEMFTSQWLRAADVDGLADDNDNAKLTIDNIKMETVGDNEKPVVYFQEVDTGLVLNKTNANTLASLFGNDTDAWIGKAVYLFTTEVDFQGKQVLSIRVRMKLPKQAKVKTAEETADVPF